MMERRLASILSAGFMLIGAACADKRIEPLLTDPTPPAPTGIARKSSTPSCTPGSSNTHAPVATTPNPVTPEDTPLTFQMTATDDDPCDTLTFEIVLVPAGGFLYQVAPDGTVGTASMHAHDKVTNPDGWLVFAPVANINGAPVGVLVYKVIDAAGNESPEQFLQVTVTPVNDAPVAVAQTSTGFNYIEVTDVTLNAQDVERGGNVDMCIVELPREGTLYWGSAVPGNEVHKGECHPSVTLRYARTGTTLACKLVPASAFPLRDSFKWKAFDGELYSNVATQSIQIVHINTPPVLATPATTTLEDQPIDVQLTAADPDGNGAAFTIVGLPLSGSLSIAGFPITAVPYSVPLVLGPTPTVTYTPNKDVSTKPGVGDRFLVRLSDLETGATRNCNYEVGVFVNSVNDAPVVTGPATLSAVRVRGGDPVVALTSDIRVADDARESDQLTLILRAQGQAAGGVAFVNPSGLAWSRVSATEITATGTLKAINAALARGVTWRPNDGTDEVGELFVSVNDNGSYGVTNTGPLVGTKTITVFVAEDIQLFRVRR